MGLIAFAVGLYALINHLSVIGSVFHFLTDLLQPLIVGAILAFFLNVPMRGWRSSPSGCKLSAGGRSGSGPMR